MNYRTWLLALALAVTVFSQSLTLVSPNGGQKYNGGERVQIKWTKSIQISSVLLEYSFNNGTNWQRVSTEVLFDSNSYMWTVPYLKKQTTKALVRVTAYNISNPPSDVSDSCFTIQAAPPDPYEPNNDFASAYPIALGDSVVKNAMVLSDSGAADTSAIDMDFYKVTLTAGKLVTITLIPWFREADGSYSFGGGSHNLELFDSSKSSIYYGSSDFNVTKTGTYYLKVSTWSWCNYGLSIKQDAIGTLALVSPNGGQKYTGGDRVRIQWTKSAQISSVLLEYSFNNGTNWSSVSTEVMFDSNSYMWTVPYLKKQTAKALVRVTAYNITNPPSDMSDSCFTIQAATPDAYEPNNDFATASPITLGDSVVKNAMALGDSGGADTSAIDQDFFKVTLTAGKLLTITLIPRFHEADGSYSFGGGSQSIELYDSSKTGINYSSAYNVTKGGTYYVKVGTRSWCNYGLSINAVSILSSQNSSFDTTAYQKTGDSASYTTQFVADSTKLSVGLTLNKKVRGSVTTMILATNDLGPATGTKEKVKAISITADTGVSSSLKTADIVIPFTAANISGNPKSALTAFGLSSATNQWTPVSSSIDSVKNTITVHTTHFSIYGVFIKSNTPVFSAPATPIAFKIKANYLSQKQCIAVDFSLPKAIDAELSLFDVRGKCVRKITSVVAGQGRSTLLWNLGALANGKYFLNIKAGSYKAQEALLIME